MKQEERKRMQSWIDDNLLDYWFMGEVVCLVPLLAKCMFLSLEMPTVNVIPWELVQKERKFLTELRKMRDALRAEKGFSVEQFPTLHKPCHGQQPGDPATYADFLETGTLRGEWLRGFTAIRFHPATRRTPKNKPTKSYNIASQIGSTTSSISFKFVLSTMNMK
jgi:hypothetical protein